MVPLKASFEITTFVFIASSQLTKCPVLEPVSTIVIAWSYAGMFAVEHTLYVVYKPPVETSAPHTILELTSAFVLKFVTFLPASSAPFLSMVKIPGIPQVPDIWFASFLIAAPVCSELFAPFSSNML